MPKSWARKRCRQCAEWFEGRSGSLYCDRRCHIRSKSEPNEAGCWIWSGRKGDRGYGQITIDGSSESAHRVSYEAFRGAIAGDAQVLHRCDVRQCVNPKHLFLGSHQDNMDDKVSKGRQAKGAATNRATVSEAQVRIIRSDPRGSVSLARAMNLSPSTVKHIRKRRVWKHLD